MQSFLQSAKEYLEQRASPWVSFIVLFCGGLTAVLLLFMYRVQSNNGGAFTATSYDASLTE